MKELTVLKFIVSGTVLRRNESWTVSLKQDHTQDVRSYAKYSPITVLYFIKEAIVTDLV